MNDDDEEDDLPVEGSIAGFSNGCVVATARGRSYIRRLSWKPTCNLHISSPVHSQT